MKKHFFKSLLFVWLPLWFCTGTGVAQASAQSQKSIDFPNFVAPTYDDALETYTINEVPSPRGEGIIGYVSDPKNYIKAGDEQRINELLYELEQKSTAQVAIVLLPNIGDAVPKDFAVRLFKKWGIGKRDTDNGLLVLTVLDQRRTEFETGYGLEPILTDVVCYRIGMNEVVPNFKAGNYGQGMISTVQRIIQFLESPEAIEEVYSYDVSYQEEAQNGLPWYVYLLLAYGAVCLLIGLWYFGVAFDIERSKDDFYDKYHRLEPLKFGCLQWLLPLPMLFFGALVKRRLEKYRYAPRFSKVNGLPLHLKDEWAENHYLEAAQILEEKLNSVRYDVWVTDDQSDVMILEYEGPNGRKYSDCRECGYKTYGKKKSTVTKRPTYDTEGERVDYYECRNCNYQESKTVVVSKVPRPTSSSSSSGGSSWSSSSSSSSSSSFGGGSSGGGGAGVSW